jgi:hypothetical protein
MATIDSYSLSVPSARGVNINNNTNNNSTAIVPKSNNSSNNNTGLVTLTLSDVSPVTRLLEKRREMLIVQDSLDTQKQEYTRREDLFKRREENLRKKDLELQESLVLFNKFLRENESKRRRAEHRTNEEIKKKLKWEKEILLRRQTLDKLRNQCDKLKHLLHKYEYYQLYLQRVFDDSSMVGQTHFDEINNIITRYNTLKLNHNDLMRRQSSLLNKNEKLRTQFINYKKEQYNYMLQLNNTIALKSRELEDKVKLASDIEESLFNNENIQSLQSTEITQIIWSTKNLYQRCKFAINEIRSKNKIGKKIDTIANMIQKSKVNPNYSNNNTNNNNNNNNNESKTNDNTNNNNTNTSISPSKSPTKRNTTVVNSSKQAVVIDPLEEERIKATDQLNEISDYIEDFQYIVNSVNAESIHQANLYAEQQEILMNNTLANMGINNNSKQAQEMKESSYYSDEN